MATKRSAAVEEQSSNTPSVDDVVSKATGGAAELEVAIRDTAAFFNDLPEAVSKAKVAGAMKALFGIKRARKS